MPAGFALALRTCGRITPGAERIVRIQDTLHLGEVQVSRAVLDDVRGSADLVKEADLR